VEGEKIRDHPAQVESRAFDGGMFVSYGDCQACGESAYSHEVISEAPSSFDEDADIRSHLAALGPAALAELRRILEAPPTYRTALLRGLVAEPAAADPRHAERDGR
jgi:hypothetical protein